MLNFKKFSQIGLIVAVFSTAGCTDKNVDPDTVDTTDSTNYQAVNSWIYEVMDDAYFWYKNMPAKSGVDNKLNPNDYFEKLIYQRTTTDRFSTITDDIDELTNEFNGVSKVFGINYTLSYIDDGKSNIAAFLSYVVKGSPAETASLRRGDIIMKVNGTQLTVSNYTALLSNSETATFTLGSLNGTTLVADNSKTLTVTKAEISEDPVLFSSVISKTAFGKTIGYLVYTQFIPGTTAEAEKYEN